MIPPSSTTPPPQPRILFVDDEPHLVELTIHSLLKRDCIVDGFTSMDAALKALRELPRGYDLILSDVSMPGTSGLVFAREVLAIWPDAPMVLISGCVSPQDKREADRLGVRQILPKPDTMDQLATLITNAIQRWSNTAKPRDIKRPNE